MIPKDRKIFNLHYDDVRGELLQPPHGTTPAAMKKGLNEDPLEARNLSEKAYKRKLGNKNYITKQRICDDRYAKSNTEALAC